MAIEQGLYAQVVIICQKYLNITQENRNKKEDKFKFQDQFARSQHYFDIFYYWIENNPTRKPDLYTIIFQRHNETQDKSLFKMFVVPIGNVKNVEEMELHINYPND